MTEKTDFQQSRNRGAILITSLWMLAILSILAMGIGFRVSVEARLAKYNMDRLTALYLAKAGVVKSIYRLSRTPSVIDSIYECGTVFSPEEKSDEAKIKAIFCSSLGAGSFNVGYTEDGRIYSGASDEERRININTAPEEVLKNLLMYVGEDPTIASSIVQWRSKGPGLDDGYYGALPAPYKCKHERFRAAEELILVKDMNKKIFDKIKNYITVFGDAAKFAVNINTAPRAVLSTLITAFTGADKIAADIYADRIITFRNGPDGEKGTKDDYFFTSDLSIERVLPELSATQAAELKK
ncbi:MAG: type II secretion system protein GspK, partial [Candidatus Omnitrophota bacterium]|nr:type II secretion system protein GspK [Candidatus Omnitrophota bacterium]